MDKKVLLIADDVEMSRKIIRKFLSADYDILEAEDGNRAMEILGQSHVDALLLDILMPGLDGLQVLEQVRATPALAHLGVLVASSTKEKTERTALDLGADDVVSKPYDPVVIRKRLENIMAVRELRSAAQATAGAQAQQSGPALGQQLSGAAASLHRIADIVSANTDNPLLLAEAARQLHREANRLSSLL